LFTHLSFTISSIGFLSGAAIAYSFLLPHPKPFLILFISGMQIRKAVKTRL
jgi:hypothetical protein